jgi:hypothetical protein
MEKVVSKSLLYFTKSSRNELIVKDRFNNSKTYDLNKFIGEYSIENVQDYFRDICEYQINNEYNVDKYKLENISLWWLRNRLIYENICLYSCKYKNLLQYILDNKNNKIKIITSDDRLKFLIYHYCTYNKIKITIYDSFLHKVNLLLSTLLKLLLNTTIQ